MWFLISLVLFFLGLVEAQFHEIPYNETLHLKPLPRNSLLASFDFELESIPVQIRNSLKNGVNKYNHYTYFPRSLGPIIENTNTRELHLRFTQGWWDSEEWGKLPFDGKFSGGTGVEVWAIIEAPSKSDAFEQWSKLANSLSGLFCASLNFIDQSTTTYPIKSFQPNANDSLVVADPENELFLLRAALPSEPICTENLTPFLKLLPTRGKAGISSLLDGHKIFDALWHGMSIDIITSCDDEQSTCKFKMSQTINAVIDIVRSERKRKNGIPKPTPGDELRCDPSKEHDIFRCFPLNDPTDVKWDLKTLFGKDIAGSALSTHKPSVICPHVTDTWKLDLIRDDDLESLTSIDTDCVNIQDNHHYNIQFQATDSTNILPVEQPPIIVSRSLTGYSQDNGGFRTVFKNPSKTEDVKFVYFEALPWYMRIFLHTLNLQIIGSNSQNLSMNEIITSRYYQPAIDRTRPSHIEFQIHVPADTTITLSYNFDKSLLLYSEYPPDANHGFQIEPAVITVLGNNSYEARTTSLLLTLPTPDFSMPYNVIILTSTVMALTFGAIFNLLVKRTVTEEESDLLSQKSVIKKWKDRIGQLKQRIKNRSNKSTTKKD